MCTFISLRPSLKLMMSSQQQKWGMKLTWVSYIILIHDMSCNRSREMMYGYHVEMMMMKTCVQKSNKLDNVFRWQSKQSNGKEGDSWPQGILQDTLRERCKICDKKEAEMKLMLTHFLAWINIWLSFCFVVKKMVVLRSCLAFSLLLFDKNGQWLLLNVLRVDSRWEDEWQRRTRSLLFQEKHKQTSWLWKASRMETNGLEIEDDVQDEEDVQKERHTTKLCPVLLISSFSGVWLLFRFSSGCRSRTTDCRYLVMLFTKHSSSRFWRSFVRSFAQKE